MGGVVGGGKALFYTRMPANKCRTIDSIRKLPFDYEHRIITLEESHQGSLKCMGEMWWQTGFSHSVKISLWEC